MADKTTSPDAGVDFWTEHKTVSKQYLTDNKLPFWITDIERGIETQNGPKFRLTATTDDGETGKLMFGEGVETRDDLLNAMYEYISKHPGTRIRAKLVVNGRTTLIERA